MEIKVGDKVRVREDAQKIFIYGLNPLWFTEESTVVSTYPDGVVIKLDADNYMVTGLPIPTKYLIKVEDEAKEPKPKYKAGDRMFIKYINKIGVIDIVEGYNEEEDGIYYHLKVEPKGVASAREENLTPYTEPTEEKITHTASESICYYQIADEDYHLHKLSQNIGIYDKWEQYTADLAHDIAVKIVNKNMENNPKGVGEYSVKVAKSVVEELKRK